MNNYQYYKKYPNLKKKKVLNLLKCSKNEKVLKIIKSTQILKKY